MRLLDLILISLRTLTKNKQRSGLTVLGVVIGIAAVTTMVSLGQSAGQLVQDQFTSLGSNVIIVLPGNGQNGGVRSGTVNTLTAADASAIATECPAVLAVSPFIGTSGQVIAGNINWQPDQMFGVGIDYPLVRNWDMATGEFFGQKELAGGKRAYSVLITQVARQLFPDTDPVGQQVRVKNIPFNVIGVLSRRGANMVGQDQDNILLMPYTTVRKRLQNSAFANIDLVFVSAIGAEALSARKWRTKFARCLQSVTASRPAKKWIFEDRNTCLTSPNVFGAIMGVF